MACAEVLNRAGNKKMPLSAKKIGKKFGRFKKTPYLCIAKRKGQHP